MKVDVGCGSAKRPGYIGIDLHDQEGVDIVCNVVKDGMPFEEGELDEIYTHHFLEHVARDEVIPLLKEFHRVLKKDGQAVIVVPDLAWVLETFLSLPEKDRWGFPLSTIFGAQRAEGDFHKTGFSRFKLRAEMESVGFHVTVCMPVWSSSQQSILARGRK